MLALSRPSSSTPLTGAFRAERIQPWHLDRLAVVYVRQSTPQQVLDHQESTRLQYGLVHQAQQFGWPPERVVVVDDDLGKSGTSAAGRAGFQRVVSEVSLDHVGIIVGIEMSRLARSNKDWHQLLELCVLFRTLIADLDGIYDPSQYNDRLLLGLKGTMSEAEIHILKQRMHQGLLSKARRGELTFALPTGYVWDSGGTIAFDPDEQVQAVVRLIFHLFDELGTSGAVLRYLAEHDIRIGVRVREGPGKGTLVWRRPNRMTLQNLLKHPLYAGAYVYGRRQVDPRRQQPDKPGAGRVVMGAEDWLAFVPDHCPAYISMAQYEANQARLHANRARAEAMGAVRDGPALLAGLVVCAHCENRMIVRYDGPPARHTYECTRLRGNYGGPLCQHLPGACLDQFVADQVLSALAPATLELSLAAAEHLEEERATLDRLWQQRRERAAYEAARAARQYQAVEPENRLVARTLERAWEEKLAAQQQLEEEYHSVLRQQPRLLSAEERATVRRLAADIPGLWTAPTTTAADRKEIVRQVVTRVVAAVAGASEQVYVRIEWVGGRQTAGEVVRPIAQLLDLSYYPQLSERVRVLTVAGCALPAIAHQLAVEGFRSSRGGTHFGPAGIAAIQQQLGLRPRRHRQLQREGLAPDEWWPGELAQLLDCPRATLHYWIHHDWVHARREPQAPWRWIIRADAAEVARLRQLRHRSLSAEAHGRWLDEHPRERGDPSAAPRTKDPATTTDQTPRALQP